MNAAELRIGNLVLLDNLKYRPKETGLIHIVLGISEKNALVSKVQNNEFKDSYGQYYEYLKPIELTEDILLKCGFEKLVHLYKIHLLNSLNLLYNSEHNGWYLDIYHNTSKIELQYLNELQNLYFCLTGKELEINL